MTLADLRKIAEAATPGPGGWWNVGPDVVDVEPGFLYPAGPLAAYREDNRRRFPRPIIAATGMHTEGWVEIEAADVTHIATFDPSIVLALLDVVAACDEDGRCRLCWNERGEDHAEDCPIARLEGLA